MHRIDTQGSKGGRFTEEVRHEEGFEEATIISADWLNDVQENICLVIARAGFPLKKNAHEQLADAMLWIIKKEISEAMSAEAMLRIIKKEISGAMDKEISWIKRRIDFIENQFNIKILQGWPGKP